MRSFWPWLKSFRPLNEHIEAATWFSIGVGLPPPPGGPVISPASAGPAVSAVIRPAQAKDAIFFRTRTSSVSYGNALKSPRPCQLVERLGAGRPEMRLRPLHVVSPSAGRGRLDLITRIGMSPYTSSGETLTRMPELRPQQPSRDLLAHLDACVAVPSGNADESTGRPRRCRHERATRAVLYQLREPSKLTA